MEPSGSCTKNFSFFKASILFNCGILGVIVCFLPGIRPAATALAFASFSLPFLGKKRKRIHFKAYQRRIRFIRRPKGDRKK